MKFEIHRKDWEGWLYENGWGKKIVGHSKLTFFWGHGECEWPIVGATIIAFFSSCNHHGITSSL